MIRWWFQGTKYGIYHGIPLHQAPPKLENPPKRLDFEFSSFLLAMLRKGDLFLGDGEFV